MTHVFNDPAEFTEDSLEGFAALHPGLIRRVPGGIVTRGHARDGRPAIVLGGGSGHYPMFTGLVGAGLADGAVVGNIFTSPSAQYAYSVARRADRGGGVVFCYGNYAGDVMNFGIAVERLRAEGIDARSVIVTDDVLSASPEERHKRRGLAGDFVVMRALAGAAARGLSLDEVVEHGERSNARTHTVGVAFAGCTFPGGEHPLFEVPAGKMAIGLGVHGEPGLELIEAVPSKRLAEILLEHAIRDLPEGAGDRVGVYINGLGATTMEELFVLWRDMAPLIAERGWTAVEPEVGEVITSLDMSGLSLTITWLDDDLEAYWRAPAIGAGYRKGMLAAEAHDDGEEFSEDETDAVPEASDASRACVPAAVRALEAALDAVRAAESDLADADAVAGDGDHGRGMVRGLEAAVEAAHRARDGGAGLGTLFAHAGDAWGEFAGGTSGVLWGAGLRAFGQRLGDEREPHLADAVAAAQAFQDTIRSLGKVSLGDKTMFDAIRPAVDALASSAEGGGSGAGAEGSNSAEPRTAAALAAATEAARVAAESTAGLRPKVGRARPLAERSLGHPDPGALSFAIILDAATRSLAAEREGER